MTSAQPGGGPSEPQIQQPQTSGPTALRIIMGRHLKRLRETGGFTRYAAGYAIRGSESKLSRLESGKVGFKERDVADLLKLYGVEEQEREALLELARQANHPGWWHKYSDVLLSWFETYVGLEQAAAVIRISEVQYVPGLLQTEDYARAVIQLGDPSMPAAEVEHRVRLRLERQKLLTRPQPPTLWAVVDEAALRRPLGGSQVLRAQLAHLIAVTALPHVTIQIAPFRLAAHSAAGGSFTILRFLEPDLPDVVYLEHLTSALYLDKPNEVEPYRAVMERLVAEVEPPAQTVPFLERLISAL